MMKSQLIMMLAAAIDHHALRSWERAHRVFDTCGQRQRAERVLFERSRPPVLARSKEENLPAARGRVLDQTLKLLFFLRIARRIGGWMDIVFLVNLRVRRKNGKFKSWPGISKI